MIITLIKRPSQLKLDRALGRVSELEAALKVLYFYLILFWFITIFYFLRSAACRSSRPLFPLFFLRAQTFFYVVCSKELGLV